MTIVIINPAGQGTRLIDCGGWSIGPSGSLDITDAIGSRFLTIAAEAWAGIQDEAELKKHASQIASPMAVPVNSNARN